MKLTRKLIEALITEEGIENRVEFKTSYMDRECKVLIGGGYFVVSYPDGTTLQQNQTDIESGDAFPFEDEIEAYTILKGLVVVGRFYLERFTDLKTI